VEDDLENGPFLGLEEPPRTGAEDKSVPCCDGEGADEEVFVSRQVGWEVERGREKGRDVWGAHGGWLARWLTD